MKYPRSFILMAVVCGTAWAGTPSRAAAQSANSILSGDSVAWTARAPGIADWIRDLTVDQNGTVWAGTDIGGIYVTSDHGASWEPRNNGLGNLYVASIAVHPLDSMLVFAGTYGGIYRSTDRGESWSYVGPFGAPDSGQFTSIIGTVAVDPNDVDRVYAGTGSDRGHIDDDEQGDRGIVYSSTDGGDSWSPQVIASGDPDSLDLTISWLAVDPFHGWVYAATHDGFYRGFQYGSSWERRPVSTSSDRLGFVALAPSAEGVLYATTRQTTSDTAISANKGGIYKSDNYGWAWYSTVTYQLGQQRLTPAEEADSFKTVSEYQNHGDQYRWIAVDPNDEDVVYIGNNNYSSGYNGVYKSTDGGGNWTHVTSGDCEPAGSANVDNGPTRIGFTSCNNTGTAIAIDPTNTDRVYFSSVNQVFKTENAGSTWSQIYSDSMASGWKSRGISVFGGVQSIVRDEVTGQLYVGHHDRSGGLQKSTDGGMTWNRVSPLNFYQFGDMVVDPTYHNRVYAVIQSDVSGTLGWRVYFSTNYGGSWTEADGFFGDLPTPTTGFAGIRLAFDAQNRYLYAAVGDDATSYDGVDDGIYRWSVDNVASWTRLADGAPAQNRHFSGIAVDPANASHLFLSIEADKPGSTNAGGVRYSSDSGSTWSDITPNLGSGDGMHSATSLLMGPQSTVYVGTEAYGTWNPPDVFIRSANGTWSTLEVLSGSPGCDEEGTAQVRALARYDDGTDDALFVGFSDSNYHDMWKGCGLWVSVNGAQFRRLDNAGLPTAHITALFASELSDELFIGVDGASVYRASID